MKMSNRGSMVAAGLALGILAGTYSCTGGGQSAQSQSAQAQERGALGRLYDRFFGESPTRETVPKPKFVSETDILRQAAHEFVVGRLQREYGDTLVQKYRSDVRNGDIFYSLPDDRNEYIYVFRPSPVLGDRMMQVRLCSSIRPCAIEYDFANFNGYAAGKWASDTSQELRDRATEAGRELEEKLDRSGENQGPWAGRQRR